MEEISMPDSLFAELTKMRRNPQRFTVLSMGSCRFCGGKAKPAYQLSAEQSESTIGAWCPVHGWLHFDSAAYPPTERLNQTEIEDNRLTEQRRREFARRKAAR